MRRQREQGKWTTSKREVALFVLQRGEKKKVRNSKNEEQRIRREISDTVIEYYTIKEKKWRHLLWTASWSMRNAETIPKAGQRLLSAGFFFVKKQGASTSRLGNVIVLCCRLTSEQTPVAQRRRTKDLARLAYNNEKRRVHDGSLQRNIQTPQPSVGTKI